MDLSDVRMPEPEVHVEPVGFAVIAEVDDRKHTLYVKQSSYGGTNNWGVYTSLSSDTPHKYYPSKQQAINAATATCTRQAQAKVFDALAKQVRTSG